MHLASQVLGGRYPDLESVIDRYLSHSIATDRTTLFSQLWRIQQDWTGRGPALKSEQMLAVATQFAELSIEKDADKEGLANLLSGGVVASDRVVHPDCVFALCGLTSELLLELILLGEDKLTPASSGRQLASAAETRNATEFFSEFVRRSTSTQLIVRTRAVLSLLRSCSDGRLAPHPMLYRSVAVWTDSNAEFFARAFKELVLDLYLYCPGFQGQPLVWDKRLLRLLDLRDLHIALEAIHHCCFRQSYDRCSGNSASTYALVVRLLTERYREAGSTRESRKYREYLNVSDVLRPPPHAKDALRRASHAAKEAVDDGRDPTIVVRSVLEPFVVSEEQLRRFLHSVRC